MSKKNLARLLIIFSTLSGLFLTSPAYRAQKATGAASFDKTVLPFITENCLYCHNAKRSSGELNLELYQTAASLTARRETWELVLQKLHTGEMPPPGAPRPDAAETKAVNSWLAAEFARADQAVKPDPGRVTARRLNRAEYNNTVRDLLGVNFRPADDFPQDDSGYGFDNIGDVLSLSPVLMEKYLTAAERSARTAVFGYEKLKPSLTPYRAGDRRMSPSFQPLFEYDQTGLSLRNAQHVTHRFPADGEYIVRTTLGGQRPQASAGIEIALWIDGQQVQKQFIDPEGGAAFDADRQVFDSRRLEFRAKVTAGEHWIAASLLNLYEGLPPSYAGPNPSKKPEPPKPEFKPPRAGIPPERLAEFKKRFEARMAEKVAVNNVRISAIEVGGPYQQPSGPPAESLKKIYVCGHLDGHHQAGCAQKIVTQLARRAYRRPIARAESEQLTGLIALAQQKGDSFEEGLCVALQALLVSPHFLFRIEKSISTASGSERRLSNVPNEGATLATARGTDSRIEKDQQVAAPINQHELAARLSYFVWSSMPDDELFRLANKGDLRKPGVLAAQVRRLLKDEKARALVENFGGQWLELRKLESVKPDLQRFPDFDDYFRRSVRQETEAFFEHIVRADRSILDFIDADYTFVNERLAQFYNIPGVKGVEFRKVALTPEMQRGGILTQASVLTVSSYTTRTSPVLRGKWILDNVLNAPPPPPPPDIPTLDESKLGSAVSLRQQLEEHRKNPTCAACHARMDPLGFGLENFDAIGAWRVKDGNFPVDATGTLPDGRTFKGVRELKTILHADRDAFAQGLAEKLLTYALGRGLERYDKPAVKKIAAQVSANDYRFSSLALEIVNSLPFQMRRGEQAKQDVGVNKQGL